jgi:hypothetical protein
VIEEVRLALVDPRGEVDVLAARPRLEVRAEVEIADQQKIPHVQSA